MLANADVSAIAAGKFGASVAVSHAPRRTEVSITVGRNVLNAGENRWLSVDAPQCVLLDKLPQRIR